MLLDSRRRVNLLPTCGILSDMMWVLFDEVAALAAIAPWRFETT